MNRQATSQDKEAIISLWNRVFGDDERFVAQSLDRFIGLENLFVFENGQVQAILSAVPCRMQSRNGYYLYALATDPSNRKGGIMSNLMCYAEEQLERRNAAFFSLIPASQPLYAYYEKRGYTEHIYLRRLPYECGACCTAGPISAFPFDALGATELAALRRRYLPVSDIRFDTGRLQFLLSDLYASGALCVQSESGYAIGMQKNGKLLVAELGAANDDEACCLIEALAAQKQANSCEVTLPINSGLFKGRGTPEPAGLWKKADASFSASDVYLRFAFDEII